MKNEVENHGGSTETKTNVERNGCWGMALERAGNWLTHKEKDKDKEKINWLNEMRGNLSTVATVIATMTFQMVLNPPGGLMPIKDDAGDNANPPVPNANPPGGADKFCTSVKGMQLCSGEAVLAALNKENYILFLIYNTVSFIASLSICLLLVSGIGFHHKFPMWLLSVGMCIILTSLALSYIKAVLMITPENFFDTSGNGENVFQWSVYSWNLLLGFIGLVHTLRLVIWGVKKLIIRKRSETMAKTKTLVC